MGRRKGRRSETEKDDETLSANIVEEGEESEGDGEGNGNGKFFACYLLTSLSPRFKGHCYIGFTVNPRRRIRQHNGEITSGATRTKKRRPWEMVLCIYGFSTNVAALQFEWAWQHPVESLAVRQAAATFKSLSGIANKIKLAYTILNLPSWRSLNLTINYFSTKYMNHMANCPSLPEQMKVQVCTIDELPRYIGGSSCVEQDDELLDAADDDCEQSGESQEPMENRSADAQKLKDVILVQDDVELGEHSRAEQGGGCRKRTFLEQLNNSPLREKLCKRSFQLNQNPVTEPSLSFSSCNKITTNAEYIGIFDSPDELLRQPKNLGIGEKELHKQSFQLNACPVRAPSMPVSSCNNMATIAEDNEIFCLPDELLRQPKSLGVVENGIRKQSFQPNGFQVRAPSLSVFSCNKEATNAEDGGIFGLPNEYIDEYDHMGKQQIPENTVPNKDQCPSTSSEVVVIDVFTPSPYFKANKRSKKPLFSEAEIIDLTNSPLFV